MRVAILWIVPLAAALGCPAPPPRAPAPVPALPVSGDAPSWAADLAATTDPSVDPCEDFYLYACGGWLGRSRES